MSTGLPEGSVASFLRSITEAPGKRPRAPKEINTMCLTVFAPLEQGPSDRACALLSDDLIADALMHAVDVAGWRHGRGLQARRLSRFVSRPNAAGAAEGRTQ